MTMVYDQPTQSLGVSGAPKPQAFEAPDYKDYGSQQQMEVGKSALNMGSQMMIVAKDMENTIAEAATRERINTLESSVQDMLMNPESGYLTKISKDAVDGSKPTLDALGELDQKLGDGCKTDLERAMYRQHSGRIVKAAKERIFGHYINQAKAWNTLEASKGVENNVKEYANTITPDFAIKPKGVQGATVPAGLKSDALDDEKKNIVDMAGKVGLNSIAYAETRWKQNEYTVMGPKTKYGRGIGRYQIMEAFWDEYAARAGYPKGTEPTPEVQDHVAAVNWFRLIEKYRDKDLAAIAWNAGEKAADKVSAGDRSPLGYLNVPGDKNSTVANYLANFQKAERMGQTDDSPMVKLKANVKDLARASGFGEDTESYKSMLNTAMSAAHMGALDKMLGDDTLALKAREYYDAYKTEIDPSKRDDIEKKLNLNDGEQFAKKVWASNSQGLDVNNGPDMEKIYAQIESSGLSDDGKRIAYAKLADLKNKYEVGKRSGEERASQDIYGMINKGAAFADIMKNIDASTTLDERSKMSLRDLASSKYGVPDPAAQKRQEQDIQHLTKFYEFQRDYASGRIPKMKPEEAAKYASSMGKYTDNAMQFVAHANEASLNVKLTMEDMTERIRVMSTNPAYKDLDIPNLDKLNDKGKAKLALLHSEVFALMAASAKRGPGKQMSVDAALAFALRKVTSEKGIFSDTKKPIYQLGTGDVEGMSAAARSAFIGKEFYKVYNRMPNIDEVRILDAKLTKGR